jgi:hypothetical protein
MLTHFFVCATAGSRLLRFFSSTRDQFGGSRQVPSHFEFHRLEHGWDECGGFVVWKLAMKPNVFAIQEQ